MYFWCLLIHYVDVVNRVTNLLWFTDANSLICFNPYNRLLRLFTSLWVFFYLSQLTAKCIKLNLTKKIIHFNLRLTALNLKYCMI